MKYLNLLKKLATYSTHHDHKMSCIIIHQGKVVSKGFNQIKTHPNSPHPFSIMHAELAALFKLEGAEGFTVIVSRFNKQGELRLARPCQYCLEALKQAKIKKLIYSIHNSWQEELLEVS